MDADTVDKPFLSFFIAIPGNSFAYGVKYVAGKARVSGDEGGDWAIVRLEGSFIGHGDYKSLEWMTRTTGTFSGYSVHHTGSKPQQWNEFESAVAAKDRSLNQHVGGKIGTSPFCEGAICWFLDLTYKGISPTYGASGFIRVL